MDYLKNSYIFIIFIFIFLPSCENYQDIEIKTSYIDGHPIMKHDLTGTIYSKYYKYNLQPSKDTVFEIKDTLFSNYPRFLLSDWQIGFSPFNNNTRFYSLNNIIANIDYYIDLYYKYSNNAKIFALTSKICLYHKQSNTIDNIDPDFFSNTFNFDIFMITSYSLHPFDIDTINIGYYVYSNKEIGNFALCNAFFNIKIYLRKKEIFKNGKLQYYKDFGNIPLLCILKATPFDFDVPQKKKRDRK